MSVMLQYFFAVGKAKKYQYSRGNFERAGFSVLHLIYGASTSGKSADFGSAIPRFESWRPSPYVAICLYAKILVHIKRIISSQRKKSCMFLT